MTMQKSRSRDVEARLSSTYLSVKPGEKPRTAISAEEFDKLPEERCVVCNIVLSRSNEYDTCRVCRLIGHTGKKRSQVAQRVASAEAWARRTKAEREAIYEKRWTTMRGRKSERDGANV